MDRLAGKVCIVTGAGNGIGRAIAILFATEGARIAIIDCDEAAAYAVESEIREKGFHASSWIADLADTTQPEAVVKEVGAQFGRVDVLVNNAATYVSRSVDEMSVEEWRKVLDTNLTAYFLCAQTSAREMKNGGGGSIVNISSVQRLISEPDYAAYAASKAGVRQLTCSLAIELAPANILVNSISPGFVQTRMSIVNGVDETTTPRFRNLYIESGRIPLRRAALPREIAAAVLFLASRECTYLTGADLIVDGGLTVTI